jgi:hypothetical protein
VSINTDGTGRLGVHGVATLIHKELGWIFREQHESDHGIDALVETVVAGRPTGRLIALQIKSGRSQFKEANQEGNGWALRGKKRNLAYWLKHQLPVVVVLFDPLIDKAYWVHVTSETAIFTPEGYRLIVPATHPLDSSAKKQLEKIIELWRYSRKDVSGAELVDVVRCESDLVDDTFSESLANSLLLHHSIHEEPLNTRSFKYAMKKCVEASGKVAELNPGMGAAMWDLRIEGAGWSLKTEVTRDVRQSAVRIDKLMAARWIRECTNPEKCAAAVRTYVPAHLVGCDRIIVLRAYPLNGSEMRYDLVELPATMILQKMSAIRPPMFAKKGVAAGYSASFDDIDGSWIFRILLDLSAEKIRMWFNMAYCHMHGSWTVKPADIQQDARAQATAGQP